MNINGIAYGPPQVIQSSSTVQRATVSSGTDPTVQESTVVELSPLGSATTGPVGFARSGVAAYSSIAA